MLEQYWAWVRAPKPECQKHVYISVGIFCRRAEYDSAKKTIAPKRLPLYLTNYYSKKNIFNYRLYLNYRLYFNYRLCSLDTVENGGKVFFRRFRHFGALVFGAPVIFRHKCKNIISALSLWHSEPTPIWQPWMNEKDEEMSWWIPTWWLCYCFIK